MGTAGCGTSGTLGATVPSRVCEGGDAGRRWRSDMKLREMPSTVRRLDLGCEAEPLEASRSTSSPPPPPPGAGWTRIAGVIDLERLRVVGSLRLKRFLSAGEGGVSDAGGGTCWSAGSWLRNSKGAGTTVTSACGSGALPSASGLLLFERESDLLRTRRVRRWLRVRLRTGPWSGKADCALLCGATCTGTSAHFSRLRGWKERASLRTVEVRLVLLDWRLGAGDEDESGWVDKEEEVDVRVGGARTGMTIFWV